MSGGTLAQRGKRLGWLARRLSRIYPAELPYRGHSVLMTAMRRMGLFDASARLPPIAHHFGAAWLAVPQDPDFADLFAVADRLTAGGLEVFGVPVRFVNGSPNWTQDPRTGAVIPDDFGLLIDFRHISKDIDIKFLWEVNRLLWWVPVAQAYAASGEESYLGRIGEWLSSWLDRNPYPLGPNWASPVEHGIRLINWSIVWHLIGGQASPLFHGQGSDLKARWLQAIYQHMHFVRSNYSRYSSADNHLIGEAAGMYVAGRTWPLWRRTADWTAEAKEIIETEAQKQFAEDGVNREQAFCYHMFSLEFLLAAYLCGTRNGDGFSRPYCDRLRAALEFAAANIDGRGGIPRYGDSDGGHVFVLGYHPAFDPCRSIVSLGFRLFHGAGVPAETAADPDEQCAWLLDRFSPIRPNAEPLLRLDAARRDFSVGGFVILGPRGSRDGEIRALFDVGSLGYNRIAGHGHADVLSVTVSVGGREFLLDSGTYCYNADPDLRRYFRGTSAHNTLTIDGQDQSIYGGSFLWLRDVNSRIEQCDLAEDADLVIASHDGYERLPKPARHRRTVMRDKARGILRVVDELGCTCEHQVELRWHVAPECQLRSLDGGFLLSRDGVALHMEISGGGRAEIVAASDDRPDGWISRQFYRLERGQFIRLRTFLSPGAKLVTTLAAFDARLVRLEKAGLADAGTSGG